ncbi:MAG: hypothetical protein ACE5GW_02895 [Planctomycetota bacterium]
MSRATCRHRMPRALHLRALPFVFLFLPLASHGLAQGYGYKKQEDPLILGVKAAIAHALAGEKKDLARAVGSLSWQVDELRGEMAIDMGPVLDRALSGGNPNRIAYALTQLVFHAMHQKFHWNLREKLKRHVPARSRLDAAHFYYQEILSGAVRRADSVTRRDRHKRIEAQFLKLRSTLGSSGLFGIGSKPPSPEEFRMISDDIVGLLREVYPDFLMEKEEKKEKKTEKDKASREGREGSGKDGTREKPQEDHP